MPATQHSRTLFGTDGIRGKANQYPITPDMMLKTAMAAAQIFTRGNHRHTVVIGKDTRQSGYMIEMALTSGFAAMGIDVALLGPLPTPAVANLTRALRADLGVMISASHNPYHDNGIKFFNSEGNKLTDAEEIALEKLILEGAFNLADPYHVGKVRRLEDAMGRYVEYAKATLPRSMRLDGLKIVIDCAHGAAYKVAPQVLWELGADVISIGVSPDGMNINEGCGATSTALLRESVVKHHAHLGIALDGDADRLIMVDENGNVINGDAIMALIATSWHQHGLLKGNSIVATQMSNLGLERYLNSRGLDLVRTAVGDRYVIEGMQSHGCNVGGEQSGHMILSDYCTTGDGLIAALQVLRVLVERGQKLSEIGRPFTPVPQFMRNVRVQSKTIMAHGEIQEALHKAESELKRLGGRLLVRPSGTEPLVRVMAEADDAQAINNIVQNVEAVILKVNGQCSNA
ncbi:phosphoglucosamine mutase [Candidatus Paracaedibacter acanthamoebae]|uniref:Phosphoglucosamine mutase n=2 Tax=Candidatus Odyssella acanthamoebae TaxID=91604 RepID=A0A077AZM8_9PROT|nr:phosphoglucosamine mutase [Candidatus Paracaedibacter acanthamoebae]